MSDVEVLAEVIDQAEKGLIEGTNVTEAWQDRVAYGVLTSDWLAAYVAAERDRAVREALAPVRALAEEWQRELDTRAIHDSNARYCWSTAARELRAALPDGREDHA